MHRLSMFLALVAALFATGASRAGDAATLEILGFTADGRTFAFEEYGIQDGSGFPYAHRFYLDTERDAFLPGTPIRVRLDNESATVAQARAEARKQGQKIVADSVLGSNRGFTVGSNAITELSADPHRMLVNPRPVFPPIDAPIEFRLEEATASAENVTTLGCEGFGDLKGFRLMSVRMEPGASVRTLHADTSIPKSRACPFGYSLGAVQTYFPQSGAPVFVVLVGVRSMGFEGPNHRWMAIPGRIEE